MDSPALNHTDAPEITFPNPWITPDGDVILRPRRHSDEDVFPSLLDQIDACDDNEPCWRNRAREIVRPSLMEDSYLRHVIAFVERHPRRERCVWGVYTPSGERDQTVVGDWWIEIFSGELARRSYGEGGE